MSAQLDIYTLRVAETTVRDLIAKTKFAGSAATMRRAADAIAALAVAEAEKDERREP